MRRHTNRAYLLLIWRDHADAPLRASLTSVATPHQQHHFTNLDELQSFLIAQSSSAMSSDTQELQYSSASD